MVCGSHEEGRADSTGRTAATQVKREQHRWVAQRTVSTRQAAAMHAQHGCKPGVILYGRRPEATLVAVGGTDRPALSTERGCSRSTAVSVGAGAVAARCSDDFHPPCASPRHPLASILVCLLSSVSLEEEASEKKPKTSQQPPTKPTKPTRRNCIPIHETTKANME